MPINILMPALSPTMEKGNLSRWLKKEGDQVKSGDILAEIETDKATMEVEAVDEGVLAQIIVPDGTADVAVNDVIGVIAADGEDATAAARPAAPKGAPPPVAAAEVPAATAPPGTAVQGGRVNGHAGPRIFASPLARRIAKSSGLDLSAIKGSGPHGRIIERDIKAALAQPQIAKAPEAPPPVKAPAPAAPAAPTPASDETIRKFFQPGSYDETPHDSMRKTIARRLVEASQTIPHFYLSLDCEPRSASRPARKRQRRRAARQGRQASLQNFGQ